MRGGGLILPFFITSGWWKQAGCNGLILPLVSFIPLCTHLAHSWFFVALLERYCGSEQCSRLIVVLRFSSYVSVQSHSRQLNKRQSGFQPTEQPSSVPSAITPLPPVSEFYRMSLQNELVSSSCLPLDYHIIIFFSFVCFTFCLLTKSSTKALSSYTALPFFF